MLKRLLAGCSLVLALTAVLFYAVWRQATRLPEWYDEETSTTFGDVSQSLPPSPPAGPAASLPAASRTGTPAESETSVRPGPAAGAPADEEIRSREASVPAVPATAVGGRVALDERRLNELLARGLREHRHGRRIAPAVRAARATLDGGRLEVGVVTRLADLAKVTNDAREAAVVRRLERLAPWIEGRDVYLAVRGVPRAQDGRLVFDRGLEVKIGGFAFDAVDLAARLGISSDELDRGLEVPIPGMVVEDVEIAGGALVLTVAE